MMVNNHNVSAPVIGVIVGFDNNAAQKTGFQIKMLVRGVEKAFDTTETVYNIQFSDKYNPYPCLGEIVFMGKFDKDGVLTELQDVNDFLAENNPIRTGFVLGTTAMFRVKITDQTPRIGQIIKIENDAITLTHFDEYFSEGAIAHVAYGGAFPEPKNGISFSLAPDINVYTWDWASALAPFSRCSREEAKARKYVTRFSLGSLEDIKRNCYWLSLFSTRGDENMFDIAKVFLNKPPGWV